MKVNEKMQNERLLFINSSETRDIGRHRCMSDAPIGNFPNYTLKVTLGAVLPNVET